MMVYTAMCRVVHRQGASGATVAFFLRLVSSVLSQGGTTMGAAVHCPFSLESGVCAGLAWVVTATPRVVPPPPYSVTNG